MRILAESGRDLAHACRALRKSPAFTVAAALTLALGIGANTAIFGLINGFFRPLAVPDAKRIAIIAAGIEGDDQGLRYRFSFPALADFREQTDLFSDVFAFDLRLGGLTIDGATAKFSYELVTGNFFPGLGLSPAAGRLFLRGEGEHAGDEPVLVLGHSYWRKRFGADPRVVGAVALFDGRPARIVGVAPPGFAGLFHGIDVDGYASLSSATGFSVGSRYLLDDRSKRFLTMAARLRPGVTFTDAQAAADVVARRQARAYPATDGHSVVRVVPEPLARPVPLPFFGRILPVIRSLMFLLASLVLLISCMNVANLLLVRATVQQRDLAVRAALGATPGRLIRLVLAEGAVLAILGGLAGLVAGRWAIDLLVRSINLDAVGETTGLTLNLDATTFEWSVLAYTSVMAVVTGVVVAMLPALRASGANVVELLHHGGRARSIGHGRPLRNLLVVAQLGGSLVLLIAAGLFVRNLQKAQAIDLGFDPGHVLTARLYPSFAGYDTEASFRFYDNLDRRIRAIPGVQSTSQAYTVPLSYLVGSGSSVEAEGDEAPPDRPKQTVGYNSVSPSYFETLRLPVPRGRVFSEHDVSTSPPVAIVNEALAALLWPGQDPIGKRFAAADLDARMRTVVGVAADSKYIAVFEGRLPHFYVPLGQASVVMRALLVRSTAAPNVVADAVASAVAALDGQMPLLDVAEMSSTVSGNIGFLLFRVGALQAAALGLLGLCLAVVGLYGVVSFAATQRTREVAIRLALGADPRDVRSLILRQGAILVAAGVAVGLVATALAVRAMTTLLIMVSTADPVTFIAVVAILTVTTLAACYLPARRAVRIDPMITLRTE